MTYLLWTLMNIALFIFFLVICFRATKLVKEKIGPFAALIFVIGLFAFANKKEDNQDTFVRNLNDQTSFVAVQNSASMQTANFSAHETLASYAGSALTMNVFFAADSSGSRKIAQKVYFSINGFVGGHRWEPLSVQITPNASVDTFRYEVRSLLKWNLLGITLYTQQKDFSGTLKPH